MDKVKRINEALVELVKLMVDRPNEVSIDQVVSEGSIMLKLQVAKSDAGKLIGQWGRTARSLRVIFTAMGVTKGCA